MEKQNNHSNKLDTGRIGTHDRITRPESVSVMTENKSLAFGSSDLSLPDDVRGPLVEHLAEESDEDADWDDAPEMEVDVDVDIDVEVEADMDTDVDSESDDDNDSESVIWPDF